MSMRIAVALAATTTWVTQWIGRLVAPQLANSLVLLLLFIAALALVGAVLALAVGIVNISLFSLLITHLYLRIGGPQLPPSPLAHYSSSGPRRLSHRMVAGLVAVSLLLFAAPIMACALPAMAMTAAERGA